MINGTVVGLQARMGIILYSPGRAEIEIECVIDTGFEPAVTASLAIIRSSKGSLFYSDDTRTNCIRHSEGGCGTDGLRCLGDVPDVSKDAAEEEGGFWQ